MDAIIFEHFYRKAAGLYKASGIQFHQLIRAELSSQAMREAAFLQLHRQYNARVLILNTQPLSETFLTQLKRGSLLIRYGVGYDNLPLARCRALGLLSAYTPIAPTQSTAELTIALMLALARSIPSHHQNVISGSWDVTARLPAANHGYPQLELYGKKATIIGYGRIGKRVAELCANAFNMAVTVVTAHPPSSSPQKTKAIVFTQDLHAALAEADVVSLHTRLSKENEHLLNATALKQMKTTALLINTARGKLVDETAVYASLRNGTLGGAAFDVFAREPLIAAETWQTLPNFIATPHQGGNTHAAHRATAQTIITNIVAYYQNRHTELSLIPDSCYH